MKQSWSSVSMEQRTNFCNKHSSIVSTWDFFIFFIFFLSLGKNKGKTKPEAAKGKKHGKQKKVHS